MPRTSLNTYSGRREVQHRDSPARSSLQPDNRRSCSIGRVDGRGDERPRVALSYDSYLLTTEKPFFAFSSRLPPSLSLSLVLPLPFTRSFASVYVSSLLFSTATARQRGRARARAQASLAFSLARARLLLLLVPLPLSLPTHY